MIVFFKFFGISFGISCVLCPVMYKLLDLEITTASSWIIISVLTVSIGSVLYLIKGKSEACPKCGKTFAMKEISRKTIGRRDTTVDIEREVKNARGEVVRRYKEAVPATKYTYKCVDECKFCGCSREVERYETIRK